MILETYIEELYKILKSVFLSRTKSRRSPIETGKYFNKPQDLVTFVTNYS